MSGFVDRYLRPHPGGAWRFSDAGKVLTWRDGETVVFSAELQQVLEHVLVVNLRLPPFLGLFVLLAACRQRGAPLPDSRFEELTQLLLDTTSSKSRSRVRKLQDLGQSLRSALEVLGELPDSVWEHPHAKAVLAGVIFDRRPDEHESVLADRCLTELRLGIDWKDLETDGVARSLSEIERGLEELRLGLLRLQTVDLPALLDAAVPQLPPAIEEQVVDDLPRAPTSGFIHELANDSELHALASLSRQCLAALHLPQHRLPEDEPELSGAANLSNRGPLHRLLLSELALDDETLAQRVALNEALYLDRERSQDPRSENRAILVDTGIRTWGHARVVSTAVAMALAAQIEGAATAAVCRSVPAGITESQLGHRSGILEHLASLDPSPRPTAALRRFLAKDQEPGAERFLITHPSVLADTDAEAALRSLAHDGLYVLAVDAEASITVHYYSSNGHCVLRRLQLDLDPHPPKAKPGSAPRKEPDFKTPPFALQERLPFYLPHRFTESFCMGTEVLDGSLLRAKDGRLMRWRGDRLGEQLLAYTPGGSVVLFARTGSAIHLVVYSATEDLAHWWIYDLDRSELERMEVPWNQPRAMRPSDVAVDERSLCIAEGRIVRVWRMGSAEPVHDRLFERPVRFYEGVFHVEGVPHALRARGGELAVEPLPSFHTPPWVRFASLSAFAEFDKKRAPHLRFVTVLRHVRAIAAFPDGSLGVLSRRNVMHRIAIDRYRGEEVLSMHTDCEPHFSPVALQPAEDRRRPRRLEVAPWRDGSAAFFDHRGLLHLRSSDASLPWITIALLHPGVAYMGGIAAATSDGRRHGSERYMRDPNCSASEVMDRIHAFARRLT